MWLSALGKKRIGRSEQRGRSERLDTQSLTHRAPSFPQREMGCCCQGGLCCGVVKVHTEQALSEPRSVNTFRFTSEGEQCCSWSYVAMEAQEKQSKEPLLYKIGYSLFQGVGQQITALLCLHIRAAVSVLFQEYSELKKDLLGSFPALFTAIWCGSFCAFWLHLLTAMWEFIYPLTVPIQSNCGQLSWVNLENSWELSLL